jgi:hypothetical protein
MILNGCASHSIAQYEGTKPSLALEDYFKGPIKAWGIVQDRSGKVINKFDIVMVGTWEGDTGTLKEDFTYYNGKTQQRIWTIKKIGDGKYEGTASDILNTATGETKGNAAQWNYVMDLPVGDKTFRVTFDDWMFLMNDGVIINRSYIKKFGITWAELTIMMQKQ